jgi:hypothetical protein
MTARHWKEWPENTPIDWWNQGRRQLNQIIRLVNQWSLAGCPRDATPELLRHIDLGLQTFAGEDGGNGWAETLREMREYLQGSSG